MELEDSLSEFASVARVLEKLKIRYQLGGSVASSYYGIPRSTLDVDVEVELLKEHVLEFVKELENEFIVTEEMVLEAVKFQRSFNLIPFDSISKIDIFIQKSGKYDLEAFKRRHFGLKQPDGTVLPYWVNSVEDVILRKLEWYRLGNEVSDQKWKDVIGVLKAQNNEIDSVYLRRWAEELGISDLLERAFEESGLNSRPDSEK